MSRFGIAPTANSVIIRLANTHNDADYYAMVDQYVDSKMRRGKSTADVGRKLDVLEETVAKHSHQLATATGPTFLRVWQARGLPASRVFPIILLHPPDAPPPAYGAAASSTPAAALSPVAAAPTPSVPARKSSSGNKLSSLSMGHRPASRSNSANVNRSLSMSTSQARSGASLSPVAPPQPAAGIPARSGSPASIASSVAPLMIDGEEQLAMLREYDTVFLVDDSGSMAGGRWREARSAIAGVVGHAMKYDDDGVDIHFLNSKVVGKGMTRARDVEHLFAGVQPQGATPTGSRLDRLLREYRKELDAAYQEGQRTGGDCYTVKPLNLIVITDGAPTDDPESALVSFAKYLDKYDFPLSQCGIQMFQIGRDAEATEALQDLDDALENRYDIRDIVDTVPYEGEMTGDAIVKVLLGGINRRLDRRG